MKFEGKFRLAPTRGVSVTRHPIIYSGQGTKEIVTNVIAETYCLSERQRKDRWIECFCATRGMRVLPYF